MLVFHFQMRQFEEYQLKRWKIDKDLSRSANPLQSNLELQEDRN